MKKRGYGRAAALLTAAAVMGASGAGVRAEDGVWTKVPRRSPTMVCAFSMTYDEHNNRAITFGGFSNDQKEFGHSNETHSLDCTPDREEWRLIETERAPAARDSHAAVYDSLRGRKIIFGGCDGRNYLNDVWALELEEVGAEDWRELSPSGQTPPTLASASAVYDRRRDRMIVFGGYDGEGCINKVFSLSFDSADPEGEWRELAPEGTPPDPREGHTAIFDYERDAMIVFGGYGYNGERNDVWALCFDESGDGRWRKLSPSGSVPPKRWGHTAVYDSRRRAMIVFGGEVFYKQKSFNDTYALYLDSPQGRWEKIESRDKLPKSRAHHGAVYDTAHGRMVVYGGYLIRYISTLYHQDAYALEVDGSGVAGVRGRYRWRRLAPVGEQPRARYWGTVSVYDAANERMITHGGTILFDGIQGRLFTLRLDSPGEEATQPLLPYVVQRTNHVAIYDSLNQRMVAWGGQAINGDTRREVYTLDLSVPGMEIGEILDPPGPPGEKPAESLLWASAIYDRENQRMVIFGGSGEASNMYYNAVYILNLVEGEESWELLDPSGEKPLARSGHTAVYDPVGQRMIVFGGEAWGGKFMNDVYELDLVKGRESWRRLQTSGDIPSGRSFHTAVYDSAHHRMIVFGGYNGEIYNDLFTLDLDSLTWRKRNPSGDIPYPRDFHTAVYDEANDRMVIFSGRILFQGAYLPSSSSYILSDLPD